MIFFGIILLRKGKYHLVRWEEVCKPLTHGGLGIRSISMVNKALLGKWLWRVGLPSPGLWRKIIVCKYKLGNDGWCVPSQAYTVSGLWKSILSVKDDFQKWSRFRVHNGQRVSFWHDEWCGQSVLCDQFSNLYSLDLRQQAVVAEAFYSLWGENVWDFSV